MWRDLNTHWLFQVHHRQGLSVCVDLMATLILFAIAWVGGSASSLHPVSKSGENEAGVPHTTRLLVPLSEKHQSFWKTVAQVSHQVLPSGYHLKKAEHQPLPLPLFLTPDLFWLYLFNIIPSGASGFQESLAFLTPLLLASPQFPPFPPGPPTLLLHGRSWADFSGGLGSGSGRAEPHVVCRGAGPVRVGPGGTA